MVDAAVIRIAAERIADREVCYCVSHIVSTLAQGYGHSRDGRDLSDLTEQAFELASPIPDYEEAARDAGWTYCEKSDAWTHEDEEDYHATAEDVCEEVYAENGISLLEQGFCREVYEHWAVSDWLADKLEAKGEKIDRDFAGMTVWARTTTGQAISADSVIEAIAADLQSVEG